MGHRNSGTRDYVHKTLHAQMVKQLTAERDDYKAHFEACEKQRLKLLKLLKERDAARAEVERLRAMRWRRYPDEKPEAESHVVVVSTLEAFKPMQTHEIAYCADLIDGELWYPLPQLPDERKEGE